MVLLFLFFAVGCSVEDTGLRLRALVLVDWGCVWFQGAGGVSGSVSVDDGMGEGDGHGLDIA